MLSNIGTILLSLTTLLSSLSANIHAITNTPSRSQVAQVISSQNIVSPELPRVYLDTSYPTLSSGRVIRSVKNSCAGVSNCYTSLQMAIDSASLGDEIVVDAGMTIAGPINLKNKTSGSGWIVIRTSNLSSLPSEGARVSPANASSMPKIIAPGSNVPAIQTDSMAHNYRIVGIEITEGNNNDSNVLVQLGTGDSYCATVSEPYKVCDESVLAQFAYNIILDRMYIHGQPKYNVKRGVGLDSKSSAIIDSYISDIHVVGQDSQAIAGTWGPGPYKIVNNYLEASTENVIFGGDDPRVVNLIPSDIEFRGNYVYKPRTWKVGDPTYQGTHWLVKNLFELKNSKRVLAQGNIFDGSWVDGQSGYAIVLTSRNQEGRCNWCVVQDVTFSNNIVRHASSGMSINGHDDHYPNDPGTERVKISNNLFDDINGTTWGGSGWGILMDGGTPAPGPLNIEISNNTFLQSGTAITASSYYSPTVSTKPSTVIINNIFAHNDYGILGDSSGVGNATLNTYFPNVVFQKNILVAGFPSLYSNYPTTYFPASWAEVLVNKNAGDYRVLSTSQYHNAGTDGKDIGVDMATLNSYTASAINGNGVNTVPPPAPAPVPIPDTKTPVVNSFDVQPRTGTGTVTASFSTSDTGGSNISIAELYRTNGSVSCNVSNMSGCSWAVVYTLPAPAGLSSWSATINDIPSVGEYYYGLHITDGANNYTTESTPVFVVINSVPISPTQTSIPEQTSVPTQTSPTTSTHSPAPNPTPASTPVPIPSTVPSPVPTPASSPTCSLSVTNYTPTRYLKYGDRGYRVTDLQTFLNQKCYVDSSSITAYFGNITRTAVKTYQCDAGIVCSGNENTTGWGLLGPKTREYIRTHN